MPQRQNPFSEFSEAMPDAKQQATARPKPTDKTVKEGECAPVTAEKLANQWAEDLNLTEYLDSGKPRSCAENCRQKEKETRKVANHLKKAFADYLKNELGTSGSKSRRSGCSSCQ